MKAPEFYAVFDEYIQYFKDAGFSKKSRNKYHKDQIEITIVLNKWGWDPEFGWGFLVRVADMQGVDLDKYERPKMRDVRPIELVEHDYVGEKEYLNLYKRFKRTNPKLYGYINGPWYVFYDENHLRQVLSTLMPYAVEYSEVIVGSWRD